MDLVTRISVVIPTLGRRESLRDCVASVLAQALAPFEVLVVDNGEDAAAAAVCAPFGTRVRVLREPRRGVGRARNRGIDAATGDVVAFIDDDARAAPDWLRCLDGCLERTGALGAGGPTEPEWEAPPPPWLTRSRKALSSVGVFSLGADRRALSPWDFLIGTNAAYRRSVFEAGHRFIHSPRAEDVEFSARVARLGPVFWEPTARVFHRIPPAKLSLSYLAGFAFDNGRWEVAIRREIDPSWGRDRRAVDAWIAAFSVAGRSLERLWPRYDAGVPA